MTLKRKLGLFFAAGLIVSTVAWYWQTQTLSPAPAATFKTIKGDTLELSHLKGNPVLVTFWATDCPGCIEEIPHLISLHRQFGPSGLTIIAVAMPYDPPNHVIAMTETKQLPYAVALDPSGDLVKAFGNVQLTPTSFLIDRNGMIVMHKIGAFDPAKIEEQLKKL